MKVEPTRFADELDLWFQKKRRRQGQLLWFCPEFWEEQGFHFLEWEISGDIAGWDAGGEKGGNSFGLVPFEIQFYI